LIQSTGVQNLTIVVFAVPEISLGASKFKVGHVTLTTPLLREGNLLFLCWDLTLSHFRDMVGDHQNLNGSRDLTTPLSVMVCRPWASTFAMFSSSTKLEVSISTTT